MRLFFLTFLCAIICQGHAWRKYHLGQKNGGLPSPKGPDISDDEIPANYYRQHLHNFNFLLERRIVDQRYFVNDEFFNYTTGNKVFLIVGGAEEASRNWVKYGPWADAAKEHKALLIMLEHRLFGNSSPFDEHTTEYLRFTTPHQALEDLAAFIPAMNTQYNLQSNVKWYAIGWSYGGTLAAFLRVRNPHLVAGAIAVSAPLQAVIDYSGYLQVVVDDLAKHSQACVSNLQKAFEQLDSIIDAQNVSEINSLFNLCDSFEKSFNNSKDIANLYQVLSEGFGAVASYQNIEGMFSITTNTICDILVDTSVGSEIQRLSKVNSLILNEVNEPCLDYNYEKMVAEYQDTNFTEKTNMRQWVHLTCNDFAWYPTSNQIFANKFLEEFFIELCKDIYGYDKRVIDVGVYSINNRYGGQNLQASNILFVHGSLDPWYPLGFIETKDERSPVILIHGTGHCAAIYPESENDSLELKQARNQMFNIFRSWVNENDRVESNETTLNTTLTTLNIVMLVMSVILLVVILVLWHKLYNLSKINQDKLSLRSEASSFPEKI